MANGNWNQSKNDDSDGDVYSYDRDEAADFADRQKESNRGENDSSGFFGPYKSGYRSGPPAPDTSISAQTGMSGYVNSALNAFNRGPNDDGGNDRSYFAPPQVDDYSLTKEQAQFGYRVGTRGPSYGITQLPEDYYDSKGFLNRGGLRGPSRTSRAEAIAYSDFMGYDRPNFLGADPEKPEGTFQKIAAKTQAVLGKAVGTRPDLGAVIDPRTGFVGEVYDDMSALDAIGNFLGLVVPGTARVDQAVVRALSPGDELSRFTQSESVFGRNTSLMSEADYEKKMADKKRQEEERRNGGDDEPYQSVYAQLGVVPARPMSSSSITARGLIGAGVFGEARSSYFDLPPLVDFLNFRTGGIVDDNAINNKLKEGADINSALLDPDQAQTAEDLEYVYAYNKRVYEMYEAQPKATGGPTEGDSEVTEGGPTGFVEQAPENVSEADTVADDVPIDVPENTFVISAAAVEIAGSDYIKKIIMDAMAEADKQGYVVDTAEENVDRDRAVSLLVSKGEVLVHPVLAKIIGLNTLNQINDRGLEETNRRLQENGQSPEAEALDQAPANPAEGTAMAATGGVFMSGQGSSGPSQTNVNLAGEFQNDSFIARPRVNYSKQKNTKEFPDGVVVNETGKNIGFALDSQMFLSDDKSLRAGIEQQKNNFKGSAKLPAEYGGETIEFGSGSKMKRYNMGATFGPVDLDVSKTQVPNGDDVIGGSVRYRFSENGDVTLETTDDGRSGRVGLNYRF